MLSRLITRHVAVLGFAIVVAVSAGPTFGKNPAGVLPYRVMPDGTVDVLFGFDDRSDEDEHGWTNFGGSAEYVRSLSKPKRRWERSVETATRECYEECRGVYSPHEIYKALDRDRRIKHKKGYRTFTAKLRNVDADDFYDMPVPAKYSAMKEKEGYVWVSLTQLRTIIASSKKAQDAELPGLAGKFKKGDRHIKPLFFESLKLLSDSEWNKLFPVK